jgi:hypothetical protein
MDNFDLKKYLAEGKLNELEETPTFKDEVISHLKSLSDKNNMNLNDSYWEWFRNTGDFNDMIGTELMNRKNPKQAAISIFSIWR